MNNRTKLQFLLFAQFVSGVTLLYSVSWKVLVGVFLLLWAQNLSEYLTLTKPKP